MTDLELYDSEDDFAAELLTEWRGYKGNVASWRTLRLPERCTGLLVVSECIVYAAATALLGAVELAAGMASVRYGFRAGYGAAAAQGCCIIGAGQYEADAPQVATGLGAAAPADLSQLAIIPAGAYLPRTLRLGLHDTALTNVWNVGVLALR